MTLCVGCGMEVITSDLPQERFEMKTKRQELEHIIDKYFIPIDKDWAEDRINGTSKILAWHKRYIQEEILSRLPSKADPMTKKEILEQLDKLRKKNEK